MHRLEDFPKNRDRFVRLVDFLKELLDICSELNIAPVLDGSLAIFAYTRNRGMNVNDIDLSCPEADFPRIIKVLEKRGIDYKLKRYIVLQALKEDLKVEFDSAEYWLGELTMDVDYKTLQVDDYRIRMLGLNSLREFYRRGMQASETNENEQAKYNALKEKYAMLDSGALSRLPLKDEGTANRFTS